MIASWKELLAAAGPKDHLVQFYEDDASLSQKVSHYLQEGLDRAEAVITIATPAHQESFTRALAAGGADVDRMIRQGQILHLDAARTLSRILKDGMPDPTGFREVVGSIVEGTRSRSLFSGLRAYGEMVDLLWTDGARSAAGRLEHLWNDYLAGEEIPLLCAYRLDLLGSEICGQEVHSILSTHSHLVPGENPDLLVRAVDGALDEVFGPVRAAALRPLIGASQLPRAKVRTEERTLLWIGRNLPAYAGEIRAHIRGRLAALPQWND